MRMSDSNSDPFAPGVCATAGMISDSGRGVFFPCDATGVTRLTDTELLVVLLPCTVPFLPESEYSMLIVPVFVPRLSVSGSAVITSVNPWTGTTPDDGVIVTHDLSDVAL